MKTTDKIRDELQAIQKVGINYGNYKDKIGDLLQILMDLTRHIDALQEELDRKNA